MANRDYKRDAKDISKSFGAKGYSSEQIASISQLLGRKGARDFFRSGKNNDIVGTLYANGGNLTDPKKIKKEARQQVKKDSLFVFTHNPKGKSLGMDQGAYEKYMSMINKYETAKELAKEQNGDINDFLTYTRDEAKIIEEFTEDFAERYGFDSKGKSLAEKSNLFSSNAINSQTSPYLVDDQDLTFKNEFGRGEKALSKHFNIKAFHNEGSEDFKKNLKSIPKNSKIMMMDHSGDKFFGINNSEFGKLLNEQSVETCYGGTCFGEDVLKPSKESAPNTKFITTDTNNKWLGFGTSGENVNDIIFPKGSVEFANGGNLYLNGGGTDPKSPIDIGGVKQDALQHRADPRTVNKLEQNYTELGLSNPSKQAGTDTIKSIIGIQDANVEFTGFPTQAGEKAVTHGHDIELHADADRDVARHEISHAGEDEIGQNLTNLIVQKYGAPLESQRRNLAAEKGFTGYDPETYSYTNPEGGSIKASAILDELYPQTNLRQQDSRRSALNHAAKVGKDGELYGRVQQIRSQFGLKPGDVVDDEMIKTFREQSNEKDLFRYYNDSDIKDILNTLASNQNNNRFNNVAALGGFIQTLS